MIFFSQLMHVEVIENIVNTREDWYSTRALCRTTDLPSCLATSSILLILNWQRTLFFLATTKCFCSQLGVPDIVLFSLM